MVRIAALLVAGAAVAFAAPVSETAVLKAKTLVQVNGRIGGLAQDGGRIAWQTEDETNKLCPFLVRVRTLATHSQKAVDVPPKPGQGTCGQGWGTGFDGEPRLALAGDRALWIQRDSGNSQYIRVRYGSLADPRERQAGDEIVIENDLIVDVPVLAGNGTTAVLAYAAVAKEDAITCEDEHKMCDYKVFQGGAFRVVGNRLVRVPGAPAAAIAALSGTDLALVSQGQLGSLSPKRPTGQDVEVRNVRTGALRGKFTAAAKVRALAVGGGSVDVLAGSAIEVHAVTGALRRSIPVPAAATDLSASPNGIVYRVGTHIRSVDPASGPTRLLADAPSIPLGLSIEGTRVAWAENRKQGTAQKARIQSVALQ